MHERNSMDVAVEHQLDAMEPWHRAVVSAAIDIRRVGFHSAMPEALLRDAALGYLPTSAASSPEECLAYDLDHLSGVWSSPGAGHFWLGEEFARYAVRSRRRRRPVPASVWAGVVEHCTALADRDRLITATLARGLYDYAIPLLWWRAETDPYDCGELARLIVLRGDEDTLQDLRDLADLEYPMDSEGDGAYAAWHLAQVLAEDGGVAAEAELRARADDDDLSASHALAQLLAARANPADVDELTFRAVHSYPGWPWARRLAELMDGLGREGAAADLRARDAAEADSYWSDASGRVEPADPNEISERALRVRADAGDKAANHQLAELLVRRGDTGSLAELTTRAGHDRMCAEVYANLLAGQGAVKEAAAVLRPWANVYSPQRAAWLSQCGDEESLAELRDRVDSRGDHDAMRALAGTVVEHRVVKRDVGGG